MKSINSLSDEKLSTNDMINDLTTGNVARKLWGFSLPFILANLLQVSYNLIDMIVVGQFVDSAGLSAVANGGDVTNFSVVICIGFASAGQVLIAQCVGRKDPSAIQKTIGTMFSFLGFVAMGLTALGILFVDEFLNLINIPPEAFSGAKEYCVVIFIGIFFIFGYNAIAAMFRGLGDSKRPFFIIAFATMLNLILDLVLVPMSGVKGAAIATVISQGTSCLGAMIYLYVKRNSFGFEFEVKNFLIDNETLKALLKLGIPITLQYGAVNISKLFVNSYINSYGVTVSAVTGIGAKIGMVASIVTTALGTAGASMVGQNFGAGKIDRINKIIYVSLGWGLIFTISLSMIFIMWPEEIFGLFSNDANVLAMAHEYVIIAVLNFNAFAIRSPMIGLITGVGNGKLAMLVGLLDGVVARIGLAILMGLTLGMGIIGFWFGNVIAGYVPFFIGAVYFWSGKWKNRKLAIEV